MITALHIENYALIQQTDITFNEGFIVITGETGAGKSIILGALGLLLGQRADLQVLGDKSHKCVVEATFDISALQLQPLFQDYDIDFDNTLLLRREILPSGKSRAFANDTPVQLPFLKLLGAHLIDIHSQHATLMLGDSAFQIRLLDTIAHAPRNEYLEAYNHYCHQKRILEALTTEEANNRKEADFVQFQFNELHEANLQSDEQEELEHELGLLQHTETIKQTLLSVTQLCDDENDSALQRIRNAKNQLEHITAHLESIEPLSNRMDSAIIELQDILDELESINNHLHYSPERQQQVEERLDLIYRLQKKHNVSTIAELIDLQNEMQNRLERMGSMEQQIEQAMKEVDKAYSTMQRHAEMLTKLRHKAAQQLQSAIMPTLMQLGMPNAKLIVEIKTSNDYRATGVDEVRFLFNANQGGEAREVGKAASGGELSRLMLAIKSMITSQELLPTIIFDEIDSGVSGNISVAVAHIMRQMASHMQVIAITHLPQIAAQASQHLKVSKHTTSDRTISQMQELDNEEARINEIASMLSSNNPTSSALQTAKELMARD